MSEDTKQPNPPADQAEHASPFNGVVPPPEHRWQPGQSGNPAGRPAAGASIIEWMNTLQDMPEEDLERIARDRKEKPARRAAAIEWLDRLAGGFDLSDFEPYVDGAVTLTKLKEMGIPTRLVKKVKTTTSTRESSGAEAITEIRREIELNDKGGQAIDRILDRTIGKAISRNEHSGPDGGGIPHVVKVVHVRDDDGGEKT